MRIESVLITGANRGIGLEFVRQFSLLDDPPGYIFATYRNANSLQELKTLQETSDRSTIILIKLDVTQPEEIEVAKQLVEETVKDRGLTLLINNAGMIKRVPFPHLTADNLEEHFRCNTVAPIILTQALLPLLERAAAHQSEGLSFSRAGVLNMTSLAGCIQNTGIEYISNLAVPSYKISKAALNMAMRVLAALVKEKGILVVNMCPGWVRTDMGTELGEISKEESVGAILSTMESLGASQHGAYINRHGEPYPF